MGWSPFQDVHLTITTQHTLTAVILCHPLFLNHILNNIICLHSNDLFGTKLKYISTKKPTTQQYYTSTLTFIFCLVSFLILAMILSMMSCQLRIGFCFAKPNFCGQLKRCGGNLHISPLVLL